MAQVKDTPFIKFTFATSGESVAINRNFITCVYKTTRKDGKEGACIALSSGVEVGVAESVEAVLNKL